MLKYFKNIWNRFDDPRPTPAFSIVLGLGAALLLMLVNVRHLATDNVPNVLIPVSIIREGNVELGEFQPFLETLNEGRRYWAARSERGLYSQYPIWTGVAATLAFLPAATHLKSVETITQADVIAWMKTARFFAWLLAALYATFSFRLFNCFMPTKWAAGLTFFSIFGTGFWIHAGSQLSNQTLPVLALIAMLWAMTQKEINVRWAFLTGFCAGLSLSARAPSCFVALAPLGMFISQRHFGRYLVPVVAGTLVMPLLTLFYNFRAFGHFLATGYGKDPAALFSASMLEGLPGLLVSPTAGLFVYSPFLLLAVFSPFLENRGWEKNFPAFGDFARWLMFGILGYWIFLSRWGGWFGGWAYGSRMMLEAVPGLCMIIALRWSTIEKNAWVKKWFAGAGIFSVLVYLIGTVSYAAPILKPTWDLRQDFVAEYIRLFGAPAFLLEVTRQVVIFIAALSAVVTVSSWFLKSKASRA